MQELHLRYFQRVFCTVWAIPGLSLRNDGHVKHDMHNKSIDHLVTYCNWENLCGLLRSMDRGDLPLRNEREVDDRHEENV